MNPSIGHDPTLATLFLRNQLFVGIPDEVLAPVVGQIQEQVFEPGSVIFEEGDWGDSLFLIATGSVKISKRGRGGLQETLAHLDAGNFFGDMALIDAGTRSAQASSDALTVLGRVDRAFWSRLLQLAPEALMTNFTRSITQRLRDNNQRFIDEMLRNERLSLLGSTVGSIVHDMNNPLTCILGACQLLQMKSTDASTAQMTGIIFKAVERMRAMTAELVDFASGNTRLSLSPVSVPELMQEIEDQELSRSEANRIKVEKIVGFTGVIEIDLRRVQRLMGNLIKNALEAMRKGGILRLEVEQRENAVVFTVADNGCGIPLEQQARIFEPFATFGKAQGTGLGLAISKAVAEAHGGSITVQSTPGVGTTFEVSLPLKLHTV